jgi:hypothetical protein
MAFPPTFLARTLLASRTFAHAPVRLPIYSHFISIKGNLSVLEGNSEIALGQLVQPLGRAVSQGRAETKH